MNIHLNLTSQILDAQLEALREGNIVNESLRGMDKQYELKDDGTRYFVNRILKPKFSELRSLVMHEAHNTKYSIHPGSSKMYLDLNKLY